MHGLHMARGPPISTQGGLTVPKEGKPAASGRWSGLSVTLQSCSHLPQTWTSEPHSHLSYKSRSTMEGLRGCAGWQSPPRGVLLTILPGETQEEPMMMVSSIPDGQK